MHEALAQTQPHRVRQALGEIIDKVVLYFKPQRKGKYQGSKFVRGEIYLKDCGFDFHLSSTVIRKT